MKEEENNHKKEQENKKLTEDSDNSKSEKKENPDQSDEEKIIALEDKLARTLAEMENQRRRFEKEKEDAFEFGGIIFAKESLSLIDNLDRAKISISNDESLKKNKDLSKFLENIEIIQKDLISIFKKNGIEQINCLNKKFDPNFHQAMLEVEDEAKEPGIVIQEIQKGFMMKKRLLRPSLVGVTKSKSEEKQKDNDEKDKKNKEKDDDKS